jgi:hypothetical protein
LLSVYYVLRQIGIEIEHGDIPDEGEEGYEGDDPGEKEAEQDDEVDDVIIVGKSSLHIFVLLINC